MMRFFCPRCRTTLSGSDNADAPHGTSDVRSQVACPDCGFVVDLALADTSAGQPMMQVVRDFTGETLGALHLEACLGSGGMGTVYKATDQHNGQTVAVKLMFPEFGAQPDLVLRFQREAATLRELQHPNIVGYRDEGQVDGQHFIVMEYIDGVSLEADLKEGTPEPARAVEILTQICHALAAAHDKGIVHRDLKPANIILSGDGVKVLDFGIAHVAFDDLTLTRSDVVMGTFNYMAPEQRTGATDIDHRADLFSVGVLFYRLLTGTLPIGMFDPPSQLNPALDRRYDDVVAQLLHNNPDKRYPDVAALLADLARLGRSRRRWVPIAVAAAAVLVLAVGGYGAFALFADGKATGVDEEAATPVAKGATETGNSEVPEQPTQQRVLPEQANNIDAGLDNVANPAAKAVVGKIKKNKSRPKQAAGKGNSKPSTGKSKKQLFVEKQKQLREQNQRKSSQAVDLEPEPQPALKKRKKSRSKDEPLLFQAD